MSDNLKKKSFNELDRPQYNSTLKLIKKLDEIQTKTKDFNLAEDQIERIHEKASCKLNLRGQVFDGLVSVEPDTEEFLNYLKTKQIHSIKPKLSQNKNNQKVPDLMEFYPDDLLKEFKEVELEPLKPVKLTTTKASQRLIDEPIDKYFKWN